MRKYQLYTTIIGIYELDFAIEQGYSLLVRNVLKPVVIFLVFYILPLSNRHISNIFR